MRWTAATALHTTTSKVINKRRKDKLWYICKCKYFVNKIRRLLIVPCVVPTLSALLFQWPMTMQYWCRFKLFFFKLQKMMYTSVSLPLIQQWTMTIVDRSSENSDHESVQLKRSPFSSGDVGMDGSCSSSWAVGPAMPGDSPRLKAQGGCVGPSPGAVVYNSTATSMDRPKEQGQFKCTHSTCVCVFCRGDFFLSLKQVMVNKANELNLTLSLMITLCIQWMAVVMGLTRPRGSSFL